MPHMATPRRRKPTKVTPAAQKRLAARIPQATKERLREKSLRSRPKVKAPTGPVKGTGRGQSGSTGRKSTRTGPFEGTIGFALAPGAPRGGILASGRPSVWEGIPAKGGLTPHLRQVTAAGGIGARAYGFGTQGSGAKLFPGGKRLITSGDAARAIAKGRKPKVTPAAQKRLAAKIPEATKKRLQAASQRARRR
jgi:hypothetical protein